MKKIKYLFCSMLAVTAFAAVSFTAEAEILKGNYGVATETGEPGNNVTWELDTSAGTLIFSGEGAMYEAENKGEYNYFTPVYQEIDYGEYVIKGIVEDGITTIGDGAFEGCYAMTELEYPDNITRIGYGAFSICQSLTKLDIPDGVTYVGNYAFEGCKKLENINIPKSVVDIGWGVFQNCSKLEKINVDNDNPVYRDIDGVLFDKEAKTIITYPEGSTLESYTIPNTVTTIADGAFCHCGEDKYGNSLRKITVPSSVVKLYPTSFMGCGKLLLYGKVGSAIDAYAHDRPYNLTFSEIADEPKNPVPVITVESCQAENNDIVMSVLVENQPESFVLMAAGYDENGNFVHMNKLHENDAKWQTSFQAENIAIVKVFCWESQESLRPLCKETVIEVK